MWGGCAVRVDGTGSRKGARIMSASLITQIRLLLMDKGITGIEAVGILESVKYSLLADAWDTANHKMMEDE